MDVLGVRILACVFSFTASLRPNLAIENQIIDSLIFAPFDKANARIDALLRVVS